MLSGESSAIAIKNGMVVLDLNPFIEAAKQQLVASGFSAAAKIPDVHPTVDLAPASGLIRAQTAYRMLDTVAAWLPWITLLLLAAGVYLARRRRRALLGVGLGVVAGMLVLAVALLVGRAMLVTVVPLNKASPQRPPPTTSWCGSCASPYGPWPCSAWSSPWAPTSWARQPARSRSGRRSTAASGRCGLPGSPQRWPRVRWGRGSTRTASYSGSPPSGSPCAASSSATGPRAWDVLLVAVGLVLALGIIEFLDQAPEQAAPVDTTAAENLPVPADRARPAAAHGSAPPVPVKRE